MIKINELKKSFEENKVLDGVNLDIETGKITVIIGRSGEGKSVLIKHIIRLLEPDEGQIFLDGIEITALKEKEMDEVRKRFGMLFQGAALFDSMTVAGNVGFALRQHTGLSNADIFKAVREKLKRVGLEGVEDMMPADLSGGMKKRVGLARAIIMDPEIVLFDEPTTGLDPIMSASIADLVIDTQKALNTTYVLITHDIPFTYKIADKIAMLHQGKIIAEGTVEEIKKNPNPVLRQFLEGRSEGPVKVY
ncbi:MAG: ABC transporter ATP-binding protein [Thermodesulfobacteriota bacterium]